MSEALAIDADVGQPRLGRSFSRLWVGVTGSAVGDGMSLVAFPLLASTLTHDPAVMSLVTLSGGLPWLLFGLLSGVLADRLSRRRLMLAADVVRLVLVAAMAFAAWHGTATISVLLAVVFLLGCAETAFSSAYPAFVPQTVHVDLLPRANARLMIGATAGRSLIGGTLGAVLFTAAAWLPFLLDSASFAISAGCLLSLAAAPIAAPEATAGGIGRQLVDGITWLAHHRAMRVLATATALLTVATAVLLGVFVLFVQDILHVPDWAYGAFMALYGVGRLAGSAIGPRLVRRLRLVRTAQLAATAGALAFAGLGVSRAWWLAALCLFVLGISTMSWNISALTFRQRLTPNSLLGRVSSTFGLLAMGAAPVGAPLGGLAAKLYGLPAAPLLAALLAAVASLLLWWRCPRDEASTEPADELSGNQRLR